MYDNELNGLAMNTLDNIPQSSPGAPTITGLVKQSGRVMGYRLSDSRILQKQEAVSLARQGGIAGVGIAHRGDTEYLKSLPDGKDGNNLGNLPAVSYE